MLPSYFLYRAVRRNKGATFPSWIGRVKCGCVCSYIFWLHMWSSQCESSTPRFISWTPAFFQQGLQRIKWRCMLKCYECRIKNFSSWMQKPWQFLALTSFHFISSACSFTGEKTLAEGNLTLPLSFARSSSLTCLCHDGWSWRCSGGERCPSCRSQRSDMWQEVFCAAKELDIHQKHWTSAR